MSFFSCRDILDKDKSDLEIVSFALGALLNVMSEEIEDDEVNIPADIGKLTWKAWLLLNEKNYRKCFESGFIDCFSLPLSSIGVIIEWTHFLFIGFSFVRSHIGM